MFCYVRTGFKLFYVSFMFLFPGFEGSAGLTYIAPGAVCAIDLIYDIGLSSRLSWKEQQLIVCVQESVFATNKYDLLIVS